MRRALTLVGALLTGVAAAAQAGGGDTHVRG